MSELEELKARAAERRRMGPSNWQDACELAETDLDRAIAIAEENAGFGHVIAAGAKLAQSLTETERDEARAAVLALRDALYYHVVRTRLTADTKRALMDTQSYEAFR